MSSTQSTQSTQLTSQPTSQSIEPPDTLLAQRTTQADRVIWINEMEDALLDFLLQEVAAGRRAGNSFKKSTWDRAAAVINAVRPKDGPVIESEKTRYKWEHMKKDYNVFVELKNHNSGVGWDEKRQCVTCSESVWWNYVQKHRDAAKFRNKGLRNYQKLKELIDGNPSTPIGEYSRTGSESLKRPASEVLDVDANPISIPSVSTTPSTPNFVHPIHPPRRKYRSRKLQKQTISSGERTPAPPEKLQPLANSQKFPQTASNTRNSCNLKSPAEITRAVTKVHNDCPPGTFHDDPDIDDEARLEIFDLFERDAQKMLLFLGIQDARLSKKWLQRQLASSGFFGARPSSKSNMSPTGISSVPIGSASMTSSSEEDELESHEASRKSG